MEKTMVSEINNKQNKRWFWRTGFERQRCQTKLLKDRTAI